MCIPGLEKARICKKEDIEGCFTMRMKQIYPVYNRDYKENLDKIFGYLDEFENILPVGRLGLFNYNNMDHCIDMGFKTAEKITKNMGKAEWSRIREQFYLYKIID